MTEVRVKSRMQNAECKMHMEKTANTLLFPFCILHFAFCILLLTLSKGGDPMTPTRKITLAVLAWVAVITAAHLATNVDWAVVLNERLPEGQRKLNVAYIPVT